MLGPALGRCEVRCLVIVMPEAIHDLAADLVKNKTSNTYYYDTTMINANKIKNNNKDLLALARALHKAAGNDLLVEVAGDLINNISTGNKH